LWTASETPIPVRVDIDINHRIKRCTTSFARRHRRLPHRLRMSRDLPRLCPSNLARLPPEHCGSPDRWRLARPESHHHGHLTEVFRADWGFGDFPVVQVNATTTTTFPGRIRAWGLHRATVDRLFAQTGSLCIVPTTRRIFDHRYKKTFAIQSAISGHSLRSWARIKLQQTVHPAETSAEPSNVQLRGWG
jgi:hypothetical protein